MAENTNTNDPRLQHSAGELRIVAGVLDALNDVPDNRNNLMLMPDAPIKVYWAELVMGEIDMDGDVWVYYPTPNGKKSE